MIKDFIKNDLSKLSYNLKEDFKSLVTPFKIIPREIVDYLFMIVKVVLVLVGLVTVIGMIQRPSKDANVDYVLQANHEQMLEETVNTAR